MIQRFNLIAIPITVLIITALPRRKESHGTFQCADSTGAASGWGGMVGEWVGLFSGGGFLSSGALALARSGSGHFDMVWRVWVGKGD